MASLISNSTGNFTTAGTWSLIDSTSFLNSEAASTASTTAFVSSSSFIPGAITIDGIAVKVLSRSATPTGTYSIRLFNVTGAAAVTGTTVTINVSDIPSVGGSTNVGWLFMKFAAPVLLNAGDSYAVQQQSSTTAMVTLYRDATAANWSRILRTTTTQAPAASDYLAVAGEYISAGSSNTFTVTMNETATTIYGAIDISTKGILSYGVAASTAYHLKVAGNVTNYTDGTFNIGTVSVPIPSTSTGKLEFSVGSNVQYGLEVRAGSTFKTGGSVITNRALLAADAAASATSLTTDVTTGWLSGDVIALASSSQTRTEAESQPLTANASGTTLTITALTNAHSGTSPNQTELANLTRNVSIFGTSASLQTYINIVSTSIVDIQSAELYWMGSATALKRGVDVGTTTGSCTINNCSVHDFSVASSLGINCNSATNNNITISNNVMYNTASVGLNVLATTGTSNSYTNNLIIFSGSTGASFGDLGGTINGITVCSASGTGILLSELGSANFGSVGDLNACSCSTVGVSLTNFTGFGDGTNIPVVTNIVSRRNTGSGLTINNCFNVRITGVVTLFGNSTQNLNLAGSTGNVYIDGIVSNAGTTFTCPLGVAVASDIKDIYISNSTFGVTTTHSTGDLSVTVTNIYPKIVFRNCLFSSSTVLAGQSNLIDGGMVSCSKFQQSNGNHKTFKKFGTITPDTVIYNLASPSARMTPSNATQKLEGVVSRFAVTSGTALSLTTKVRKSVVGDGTAYNGNQPRMILKASPAAGINSDVILATASGAAGSWETLSGTSPTVTDDVYLEVIIDCDGTAGWVNVDDMSASVPNNEGFKYWFDGRAFITGTSDASAFYTDPGVTNVRLGTLYQFNSLTNNRTGTVRVPTIAQVKTGVLYDDADSLTGTYDGSDRWTDPGESNVRLSTAYKANSLTNNKTGNVRIPSTGDVRLGVVFDSLDSLTGTFGGEIDYHSRGIFSIDGDGNFQGSLFLTQENTPVTSGLTSASYTIYDESDAAVAGLSQSGIVANGNGVFLITPVANPNLTGFNHYRVKISIIHSSGTHESWTGFTIGEIEP